MSILIVGTVAFDAIETPYGKTDKIVGGAATYISLSASFFSRNLNLVSVVGEDFPKDAIQTLEKHNVSTKGLQIKKGEKNIISAMKLIYAKLVKEKVFPKKELTFLNY